MVRVVPGDLDQVLLNLAVNASDAMPQGGTLTIEVSDDVPPPSTLAAGSYVCIEVRDTGSGMSPEVLARAFDPFYTTKSTKGHGLGLAVSESIVRRAGGLMTAQSKVGEGTTFRIWLPLDPEAVAPTLESSGSIKLPIRGARILLVEDQDSLRSLLERQLTLQGYQVTAARSCEEALTLSCPGGFDLLLSDIVLPGMNGVDLARRLSTSVPHILLMSGFADQAPVLDGKPLPLLSKPFTTRQLSKRLIQVLGSGRKSRNN
ncbi:MAG: ATP-binding protein, partial [Vulcanimicrobiota bacterium]